MTKTFKLSAEQIRPLVRGLGGCIASDRITVDGMPVGTMYRDAPEDPADSGWVFLAGDETQEYLDDAGHMAIFEVNTIANYDPSILPFLYALPGQRFDRVDGRLTEAPDSEPDASAAGLPPGCSVVQGLAPITDGWVVDLPGPFRRRIEEGAHVFWRPGLTLFFEAVMEPVESIEERLAELRADISVEASELRSLVQADVGRLTYRLREDADDARAPALYGFVVCRAGHLAAAAYFDREEDALLASGLVERVRHQRR